MRKILLLATGVLFMLSSFASVTPSDLPKNASHLYIPIGATGKKISLMELSVISVSDFEKLSGKKMGFMKKLSFKMGQKKLRKNIKEDGSLSEKTYNKLTRFYGGESGFHLGGFALGFFLGLIGLLLAYLVFNDDYKDNRVKWAWIGLGVVVLINLILIVFVLSKVDTTP